MGQGVLTEFPTLDWTGPLFLSMPVRPVKVVVHDASARTPLQPSVFLPIWKAASTSVIAMLDDWYGRAGAGPHDPLDAMQGSVRLNTAGEALAYTTFSRGPLSTSPAVSDAIRQGAVVFTVVRHPLTRFVSGAAPHERLAPIEADSTDEDA